MIKPFKMLFSLQFLAFRNLVKGVIVRRILCVTAVVIKPLYILYLFITIGKIKSTGSHMSVKNRELRNQVPRKFGHLEGIFTSKIKKYIKKWKTI